MIGSVLNSFFNWVERLLIKEPPPPPASAEDEWYISCMYSHNQRIAEWDRELELSTGKRFFNGQLLTEEQIISAQLEIAQHQYNLQQQLLNTHPSLQQILGMQNIYGQHSNNSYLSGLANSDQSKQKGWPFWPI